ncbi:MAG TPA: prepilin-type N-terminal cleavage/methylation domain-containing protein [Lacunisphaera sp.]|nr:prepilin-type N-terminal cleavage/methylation domain-containing protein [Lacunisphaera sp.]
MHKVTRAGFTLVEVMMAMAIVVVGIVGMMQAVTIGTELLDTTSKQQVAVRLVKAESDRLRNGAWTVIANLPASAAIAINSTGAITGDTTSFALSNFTAAAGDDDTELSTRAAGFTCSFAATRLRPTGATATTVTFVKVVYTVTWTSSAGRAHRRTMETYFGMNGLHLSYQQA